MSRSIYFFSEKFKILFFKVQMQRGFTSETGKAARRKRTENETNDEIGSLKKTN